MNKEKLLAALTIWFGMSFIVYLFFAFISLSWDYLGGDNQGGRFLFGGWVLINGLLVAGASIEK